MPFYAHLKRIILINNLPVAFPLACASAVFGSAGLAEAAVFGAAAGVADFFVDFDECFLLFFGLFNSSFESDEISSSEICSAVHITINKRKMD